MSELVVLVSLFEEVAAGAFDRMEAGEEVRFVKRHHLRHERSDCLAAFSFGACGGIAADDGFLVVQAELDGCAGEQAFQQLHHAAPAVDGEAGEAPAFCCQVKQALLDGRHGLAGNLLPVNVPARCTIDQQAISSAEERGVKAQRDGMGRNDVPGAGGNIILEPSVQGAGGFMIANAQLSQRLLADAVLTIGTFNPPRLFACRL